MRHNKIAICIMVAAIALAMTACKGKAETSQTTEAESRMALLTEAQTTGAANADENEIEESQDEGTVEEEMRVFADMVKEAFASKDMTALEKLLSYPTYLGDDSSAGLIINSTDEFLALKPEQIFTGHLVTVIAAVDTSALEMTEAGVVMGEGTPNVTFNLLEGNSFGITGINE